MFAYKTNSADYLDYVAATLSREQILADPDLCLLLENPYIKDNMEIALRWNAAKYGDYQDKYDFMEYLMCNGPELDADTILHYRAKADTDPVCMEIAYSYLSNVETLSEIRSSKYKKETGDCFTNPCFYMGKFSAMMGSCGDVRSTYSPFNYLGNWINGTLTHEAKAKAKADVQLKQGIITPEQHKQMIEAGKKLDQEEQQRQASQSSADAVVGSQETVQPTVTDVPTGDKKPDPPPPAGMRACFENTVIPAMKKGWNMMMAQIFEGNAEFTNELINNTNCITNSQRVGDWMAQPMAQMIDLVSKANVKRQLGDCARLWSQVRRLRIFGSENAYGPITADQLVGNTYTDGTPMNPIANPNPTAEQASATVEAASRAKKNIQTKAKQKKLKQRTTRSNPAGSTTAVDEAGRTRTLVSTTPSPTPEGGRQVVDSTGRTRNIVSTTPQTRQVVDSTGRTRTLVSKK